MRLNCHAPGSFIACAHIAMLSSKRRRAETQWELPRLIFKMRPHEEGITMLKSFTKRLPSLYIDVPVLRPGTVGAYALAFASAGVATALRLVVDPYVVGAQFVTFFPAVVITTLISGFG